MRFLGLVCLAGVGIAAWSWFNTDKIMNPVRQKVIIDPGEIISLEFKTNQEISQRNYDVNFYFDRDFINCGEIDGDEVDSLGLSWSISSLKDTDTWNDLARGNHACFSFGDWTTVRFPAQSFLPNTNYFFHLSRNNLESTTDEIEVRAAIQHEHGIGTHYLFMNKAIAEILGGVLLIISLLCFLIDILLIYGFI